MTEKRVEVPQNKPVMSMSEVRNPLDCIGALNRLLLDKLSITFKAALVEKSAK